MGNCLVTKLKSVVNNNNLVLFGALPFDTRGLDASETVNIVVGVSGGTVQIIDGDGNIVAESNEWINSNLTCGKVYSITSPDSIYHFNLGNNGFSKTSKIKSNFIYLTNTQGLAVSMDTLAQSLLPISNTSLTHISLGANTYSMNKIDLLQWLNANTRLSDFSFYCYTNKFLTMDDFGKIGVPGTLASITGGEYGGGRIEDYVARRRQLGYTSGTVTWNYITEGSTFNGNIITDRVLNILSWTATTITFGGVEIQNSEVAS